MITLTIEIPDEVAMELNAHIARFKSKLHIDVKVNEMVLTAINGYLIEHSNDIEDYRIAHEPPKRQHKYYICDKCKTHGESPCSCDFDEVASID